MVLGSPMKKYSEASPQIADNNANGREEGAWDVDKETRQSNSNAAYDVGLASVKT